jgi:hypothetical protein
MLDLQPMRLNASCPSEQTTTSENAAQKTTSIDERSFGFLLMLDEIPVMQTLDQSRRRAK